MIKSSVRVISRISLQLQAGHRAQMTTSTSESLTSQTVALEPEKVTHLTYKESFQSWLERKPLSYYEAKVLEFVPFFPKGDDKRKVELINTEIDLQKNYIHEFYIENVEQPKNAKGLENRHIVMIHGYGASLGFFYKNFDGLSKISGVKIHALDLLGFGLSSRPKFPKYDVKTIADIHKSEDWFIDSVEEWRKIKKIDKFVLIGHSLGGYLSSCYALKYPQHIDKLVLVSPVGVERSDYSLYDDNTSSNVVDRPDQHKTEELAQGPEVSNEYYQGQEETVSGSANLSPSVSSSSELDTSIAEKRRTPNLPKLVVKLWERHTSPFSIVRGLGPFASRWISYWSFNRFGSAEQDEMMKMHMYAYKTFTAKGSGEYALTRLLAPGALLRLPLIDRLPGQLKMPSLWLYGDRDWMSRETGKACCDDINKESGAKMAKFKIVPQLGHHVYLDNPPVFDSTVEKFIGWT